MYRKLDYEKLISHEINIIDASNYYDKFAGWVGHRRKGTWLGYVGGAGVQLKGQTRITNGDPVKGVRCNLCSCLIRGGKNKSKTLLNR